MITVSRAWLEYSVCSETYGLVGSYSAGVRRRVPSSPVSAWFSWCGGDPFSPGEIQAAHRCLLDMGFISGQLSLSRDELFGVKVTTSGMDHVETSRSANPPPVMALTESPQVCLSKFPT